MRARRWEVGVRVCDICRFEEPSHAPWCPAGRKPMEPPVDTFYIPGGNRMDSTTLRLSARIEQLEAENHKLRALVREALK